MISVIKEVMVTQSSWLQELGIFVLRVGIGTLYVKHGFDKIVQGPSGWNWLGSQMSLIGIAFFPIMWGLCAVVAEFVGGCALVLGLGTRIAAFFLSIVMIIAVLFHVHNGDAFSVISHPISNLIVFLSLMFIGSGCWSVDYLLK